MICDYGCGKEAKYQLKNGKWCCGNHYSKCSSSKNKPISIETIELCSYGCKRIAKFRFKNGKICCSEKTQSCPTYVNIFSNNTKLQWENETEEQRLKKFKKQKESWDDNARNNMSEKTTKRLSNPDERKNLSEKQSEKMKDSERRKNLSLKCNLTLEKIKDKYPFLLEIEELKYKLNDDNLIIQGRCKNKNCNNSKEHNGWFDLSGYQISMRILALKNKAGNHYFYCSEKCKVECELFKRRIDFETLDRWKKYKLFVYRETSISIRKYHKLISNIELRGEKYGYDLDHKFSVYDGFVNDINPKIIGHYKNLEVVDSKYNRCTKNKKSFITIEELLESIKES
jgi:hypothetical protein